jgi:hypothetical protein
MLHLLLDWEYPHWMMMAGAILVAAGFIGLAFHRNRNGPVNDSNRARESTPTERLNAMREPHPPRLMSSGRRRGNDVAVPELTQNTLAASHRRITLFGRVARR